MDELYSVAVTLSRNMVGVCGRLSDEAKSHNNEEAAAAFSELAALEKAQVAKLGEQAQDVNARTNLEIEDIWSEQALRGDTAREMADNPYLLTRYRAIQIAVLNKERIFEILSTIASRQTDIEVRQHAESMARQVLSEISDLRLRRRRAYGTEVKTAISAAGLDTRPATIESLQESTQTVSAIIRAVVNVILDTWSSQMTGVTEQTLREFVEEFKDATTARVTRNELNELEARIKQDNNDLFSALKTLLRELESAIDLFLEYAEDARTEDVVASAQTTAERLVGRTAIIRNELGRKSGKE